MRKILSIILLQCSLFTFCNASPLHLIGSKVLLKMKPGCILYAANNVDKNYLLNPTMEYRRVIDIRNSDSLCLSKGGKARAVAYTNLKKSMQYDSYMVEYKGDYWFVKSHQVVDNTMINEVNKQLVNHYETICADVEKARLQFQSSLNFHKQRCQDSLSFYESIWKTKAKFNDSILYIAQKKVDSLYANEQKKINTKYNNWYNRLSEDSKKALKVISIDESRLSRPNSVGGCSWDFSYRNLSSKVVKYIYTTLVIYNAVNDLVDCEIRRTFMFNGVSTGPVAPGDSRRETYPNIIYNHSADYVRLIKLKIVYIDGTSFIIKEAAIKDLQNVPNEKISFDAEVEANKIQLQAQRNIKPLHSELSKSDLWKKRLENLRTFRFVNDTSELVQDDNYNEVYLMLSESQKKVEKCETAKSLFEENNLITSAQ